MGLDIFIEPPTGAALTKANACVVVPLLVGAHLTFSSVCTQGFISGFALIPPWALQECRAYGTHNAEV